MFLKAESPTCMQFNYTGISCKKHHEPQICLGSEEVFHKSAIMIVWDVFQTPYSCFEPNKYSEEQLFSNGSNGNYISMKEIRKPEERTHVYNFSPMLYILHPRQPVWKTH